MLALGYLAERHADARIATSLVALYQSERQAKPDVLRVIPEWIAVSLERDRSAGAYAGIQDIIQFESTFMSNQGLAPWNDPDAVANARQAAYDAGQAIGQAMREKREPTPQEAAIIQAAAPARQRMAARLMWERLVKTRDVLQQIHDPQ